MSWCPDFEFRGTYIASHRSECSPIARPASILPLQTGRALSGLARCQCSHSSHPRGDRGGGRACSHTSDPLAAEGQARPRPPAAGATGQSPAPAPTATPHQRLLGKVSSQTAPLAACGQCLWAAWVGRHQHEQDPPAFCRQHRDVRLSQPAARSPRRHHRHPVCRPVLQQRLPNRPPPAG